MDFPVLHFFLIIVCSEAATLGHASSSSFSLSAGKELDPVKEATFLVTIKILSG